jgi:hypothetical protein
MGDDPAKPKRRSSELLTRGVPPDMCLRCGLRTGRSPHEDAMVCIGALSDAIARHGTRALRG